MIVKVREDRTQCVHGGTAVCRREGKLVAPGKESEEDLLQDVVVRRSGKVLGLGKGRGGRRSEGRKV